MARRWAVILTGAYTMSLITISTAVINYTSGTTDCQLSVAVDVPTVGPTFVANSVSLSSADLCEDWTDAQLCAAVAAKLGVPVDEVSVADAPVPPAPVDVPEISFGNLPQVDTPQPVPLPYKPVVGGV